MLPGQHNWARQIAEELKGRSPVSEHVEAQ
jgi:hypothetical protein